MPLKDREARNAYMREYNAKKYQLPKCKSCGKDIEKKKQYCPECCEDKKKEFKNSPEGKKYHQGYHKQWYQDNKELKDKQNKKWQKENPKKYDRMQRKGQWKRSGIVMKSYWKKVGIKPYGTWKELLDLRETTTNCELCGIHKDELNHTLHLDHNHDTGEPRGFICKKCNTGLGNFNDDIDKLKEATSYLQRYKK